jgi:hypothetical protein
VADAHEHGDFLVQAIVLDFLVLWLLGESLDSIAVACGLFVAQEDLGEVAAS